MKKLVLVLAIAAAACGGKSNGSSTPTNTGGTAEPKKDGAPMGGATYGSAATDADPCAAPADPCAAPPH
jgi:hypothetical protein